MANRSKPTHRGTGRRPSAKVTTPKKRTTKKVAAKKTAVKKTVAKKHTTKNVTTKKAPTKRAGTNATNSTTRKPVQPNGRAQQAVRTTVAAGRTLHVLDVPFEEKDLAAAAGARWNPELKNWTVVTATGAGLDARLTRYAAARHSWESWQQDDINQTTNSHSPAGNITLHQHQQQAAELIADAHRLGRAGFLLADEVGLGKTYSALAGIEKLPGHLNVLVLSPLAVVYHWRRSIDAIGAKHRYCVINYDRAKKLLEAPVAAKNAKRTRTKNQRTANKGRSLVAWDVVVADESHLLKNPNAQRSAAVRQISIGAFTVWCSATAGQNPVELSYLHQLIGDLTGRKVGHSIVDYATWCKDLGIKVRNSFGGLAWDRNPEDLTRIKDILFSGVTPGALRRRPSDIVGWPELERIAWPVGLTPVDREIYDAAWEEVRRLALEDREQRQNSRRPTRAGGGNSLVALLRFRQKASALRIDATADLVETLLENDKQVAVSTEFLDTLRALEERLARRKIASATIHGAMSAAERETNRIAFQQGHRKVVLFTVKEGISLHAGEKSSAATTTDRITVIHDPRWDAISTAQIEGRTWRDGQRSTCYHTYAANTAEEKVVSTMLSKLSAMKTMLADDPDDITALLDLLIDS